MVNKIINGDCLKVLKTLPDNSVDAIVTDPPYGISFMGKKWDYDVPKVKIWKEVLRVLKPGGYALVACGTRTQHRMAVNLEDAGFEIRDIIAWVYGSGFPKSLNVAKAIQATEKYGKSGTRTLRKIEQDGNGKSYKLTGKNNGILGETRIYDRKVYSPTGTAKEYEGWGTALKPAMELWTLCRKPLEESTVAANVLKYGTGGINIDECRVDFVSEEDKKESTTKNQHEDFGTKPMTNNNVYGDYSMIKPKNFNPIARFPANFIHDGSEEVLELFPETKSSGGQFKATDYKEGKTSTNFTRGDYIGRNDSGSAARFFYCAKASKSERNAGLDGFDKKFTASSEFRPNHMEKTLKGENGNPYGRWTPVKNNHPTVKPVALMRYLCRLITPKGGTVLDPFAGSGSTGIAAELENFNFIGIEISEEYCKIAEARIKYWKDKK